MVKRTLKKQIFPLIVVILLVIGLILSLLLIKERQILEKKASSQSATLSLLPSSYNFNNNDLNSIFALELWANFTGGSSQEKLTYFQTKINFPNQYFELAEPIDVSPSGLNQIIRVEIPSTANATGVIYIQIGAISDSDERPSTGDNTNYYGSMKIATMRFRIKKITPQPQSFIIDVSKSQVVNNQKPTPLAIPINAAQNATVYVSDQSSTNSCSCDFNNVIENNCVFPYIPTCVSDTVCQCIDSNLSITPTQPTFITPTITISITPTPSEVPPETPLISFRVKLRSLNTNVGLLPTIIRVRKGDFFKEYNDVVVSYKGNGVYGLDDFPLLDVPAGQNYKIFVKGPKHLAKGFPVNLVAGNNPVFDWTNEELEPGDLPPQDGKINALDISRLIELLGVANPSAEDLYAADLNYDEVINGADTNEMILTLSTKYDDDLY